MVVTRLSASLSGDGTETGFHKRRSCVEVECYEAFDTGACKGIREQ